MSVKNGEYSRTNLGPQNGNVFPRFYVDSIVDRAASELAGREIYKDEERVEIVMPGNPHTMPVLKVTDVERQRWPKEYEAFKAGIEMSPDGTPLEEWATLKRGQILELKYLGFKTVEHIRDMDDRAIQQIGMGGRVLRDLARAFLDDAERMALASRLSADNERKDMEIARLTRTVEELGARVESLFAEGQLAKNAQPALATFVPGMHDPVAIAAQQHREPIAPSSLDSLAKPRKGGRPALPRDEAGNIIRKSA